jgi:hypothetical protein
MSENAPTGFRGHNPKHQAALQNIVRGEFVGSARWVTASHSQAFRGEPVAATHQAANAQEDFAAAAQAVCGEEDTELGAMLGAIAEEVHQIAAAVQAGIMADFAARVVYARRHLPKHQIAGALAAIKQMRAAALAVAKQNAKTELAGRKKAAVAVRWRSLRPVAKHFGRGRSAKH